MELQLATWERFCCGPDLKDGKSLSWLASAAVIKHGPKTTREKKGLFFDPVGYSPSLREFRTETMAKSCSRICFQVHISELSDVAQAHLPRDDTAHSGLRHSVSISKQENAPPTCPQASLCVHGTAQMSHHRPWPFVEKADDGWHHQLEYTWPWRILFIWNFLLQFFPSCFSKLTQVKFCN